MIKKNLVLVFLGIYALVSCTNRPEDDEPVTSPVVLLSEKNIPERMLKIDTRPDTLDADRPAQHLFGRFFNKNAEFYVIDSPNKTLYNQPVKSITLYYLAGILSKTKYTLDVEISDQLIASLGAFSIRGYDSLNRKLVRTEGILITEGDNKILNKKLDNYQLKWDREDKFILMRVDKTKKEKRIEYIELLKNYESIYNLVEGASF